MGVAALLAVAELGVLAGQHGIVILEGHVAPHGLGSFIAL